MPFISCVLPIDVGFGNTKMLRPRGVPIGRAVSIRERYEEVKFESVAVNYSDAQDGLDGYHRDSCILVTVDGKPYAVGANARRLLTGTDSGVTTNPDFCLTEHHRALVYAALALQSANRIDVLVLGLPVHIFKAYRQKLAETFIGNHQVSESRRIHVQSVKVCPQPMGGFYDHAERISYSLIKMARVLVIDPGSNTLDWYFSDNARPVDSRCGARSHAGMQGLLKVLAGRIAKECDRPVAMVPLETLAAALLCKERAMFVGGRAVQIPDEWVADAARSVAAAGMKLIRAQVEDSYMHAINHVVVVGGGAPYFIDEVRRQFPELSKDGTVTMPDDPVFANVRGFMTIGQVHARSIIAELEAGARALPDGGMG